MGKEHPLKTSEEWAVDFDSTVYDPDGWDRHNFEYSWYEERITWAEFMKRAMRSSLIPKEGPKP
jgi:hypothetical protein